jgi:hypothetical protein
LPFQRANCGAAAGLVRFRRNVAIPPVGKMLHLKVQVALFFQRISHGVIVPMDRLICIRVSRNGQNS